MKFIRIVALCLALLLLATAFVACDDDPPIPTDDSVDVLTIVQEGLTDYVIVRDYQASNEVIDAITNLVGSIEANIGPTITIKECYNNKTDDANDIVTQKEILIGMTNRQESIDALTGLRSKDFNISISGTKLVIGSTSDEGTVSAISKFVSSFVMDQGDLYKVRRGEFQDLTVSKQKSIQEKGTYSYASTQMAGVRLDSFDIYYPRDAYNSTDCQNFAKTFAQHLSKETGYELKIYKDTRYWSDYEILIGQTVRTEAFVPPLGENEYYIQLIPTEVTYEDGTTHPGAQLIVCFGRNAQDAAMEALAYTMFPLTEGGSTLEIAANYLLTNRS